MVGKFQKKIGPDGGRGVKYQTRSSLIGEPPTPLNRGGARGVNQLTRVSDDTPDGFLKRRVTHRFAGGPYPYPPPV